MKYWIALFLLVGGFFLAMKPQLIQNFYGKIGLAERGMWATFGGSRFMFQLVGIIMIILAVLLVFVKVDLQGAFG
ncbi:hypothetical protein KKG41_06965 [Patescibacteria group bacterium]|nr:hypothetical protein [Patescibacteria group bacterium]MBU1890463.1 hypothetical protein [Patescibacteria group bacterium]